MKEVFENLNRPQIRRDRLSDNWKAIVLVVLIACALLEPMTRVTHPDMEVSRED